MKIFSLFISLLLFTSCSKISLGYQFGDWIINSRVKKYIRFQGNDRKQFDKIIDQHLEWHKSEVLPLIIKLNDDIIADVNRIHKSELEMWNVDLVKSYFDRIKVIYHKSVLTLIPSVSPLLSRINQIQLDRISKKLYAGNERIEDQMKVLEEELIKQKKDQYLENFKEWFGSVNKSQNKKLNEQFPSLFVKPKNRLASRSLRIRNFLECYDEEDLVKRSKKIEETLLTNWSFSDRYSVWRTNLVKYIVDFLNDMDEEQAEFFKKTLNDYQSEFKKVLSSIDS